MAAIAANNPLLNPGATLKGKALLQAAQGLVDAKTQGPLTELAKQIAQNNQQTTGAENLTGGYFNQLGQQAQSGVDQTGKIATGLKDTLSGIGDDTQSQLRGIGESAMAGLSKYTPQGPEGGLNQSAMGSLAQEIARQQGLAVQNAGTYQAYGTSQGANLNGLAAANLGTFALRGQEALKGALLSNAVGELRQQEIANSISRTSLLSKEQIAAAANATSAANTAAREKGANARSAAAIAARQAAAAALRQAKANAKGGGKGLSQGQQNTLYQTIDKLPSMVHLMQQPMTAAQAKKTGRPVGSVPSEQEIRAALGAKYDPTFVEAAYELAGWGHILPQTASKLYQMGLRGTHFKVGPAPAAPAAPRPVTAGLGAAVTGVGNALGGALTG